uniref:Uncharacterized protein n=1 Tax=Palpitomonas bilix TaxID=652834 RepID=A0A7S3DD78_9EUKA|mmetsp:Transcript_32444/g.84017  ORF Transcript_32444/g.84017 Transcript_32444/m.84017 type:complete len:180 (+) Transcript_32444:90-629(+)
MSAGCDYVFKILLIGDFPLGKTSLISRFADGVFPSDATPTTAVDMKEREIEVNGKTVKLQLYDTPSDPRFREPARSYYRIAHAVFFLYDTTNRESFLKLPAMYKDVEWHGREEVRGLVVGTKNDLSGDKQVEEFEAQDFASSLNMRNFETSAKDGSMVEVAFTAIALELMESLYASTSY